MRPPPRRVPWPSPTCTAPDLINASNNDHNITTTQKRKERDDDFERPKKPNTIGPSPDPNRMTSLPKFDKLKAGSDPKTSHTQKGSKPMSSNDDNHKEKKEKEESGSGGKIKNELMAGCLAHEYLSNGTLLGRRWDQLPSQRVEPQRQDKYDKYVELATLLKTDGAHLSGVLNPTQIARYLRLFK